MKKSNVLAAGKKAEAYEELAPLIEFCKAGKLFDVQEWIRAGNPVNPPALATRRQRKRTPLDIAIDEGFHSMVQVLLEAGADIDFDDWSGHLSRVLKAKRLDILLLLVEHGLDPSTADMRRVFETWEPQIMEFFIERGAEVEKGRPLAYALCERIRTALGIFKKYQDRFPTFREQANIALRHQCKEGNLKWVSLLIWAGADPYTPGVSDWDEEDDEYPDEDPYSALAFAALYEHFDIFKLKTVRLRVDHPAMHNIVRYSDRDEGLELLNRLLDMGYVPNDQENGGSSIIQSFLEGLDGLFNGHSLNSWSSVRDSTRKKLSDTTGARQKMKAIHVLAKHGARWVPKDKDDTNGARRALLKMVPDYTAEFVWIMSKHKACSKEALQDLLRTDSMKRHVSAQRQRIAALLAEGPDTR